MSLITVQFDTIVYWAGGAGIAGVELSKTDEFLGSPETAVIHEVLEGTGDSNILTYVVTWPTEPVAGDLVTFTYTAADGFYQDSGAVLMADKTLDIRNCGSPLPPIVILPIGTLEMYVGVPFSLDVTTGFDEGTGVLTGYTVGALPSGLVFDGQFITGTPDTIASTPSSVTCTTDVLPAAVDSVTWDVVAIPVAPTVVTPILDQSEAWGTVIHFDVTTGFDTGTGTPVFTVDNAPPGLLFDGTFLDGTLNTVGTYPTVTVTCATGVLPDAVDVFSFEVTAVAPSVVTPIVDQVSTIGDPINMDMTTGFNTGSGTPVVFTMLDIPSGLAFDGQFLTGTLDTVATYNPSVTCSTGVLPDAVDTLVWEVQSAGGGAVTYEGVILADNPVAYWRMDEASGVVAVDEIDSPAQDGIYNNAPVLGFAPLINEGSSVSFNGSNEWMRAAGVNATPDASDFSWECWAKFTDSEWRIMDSRGTGGFGTVNGLQFSEVISGSGTYSNTGIDDGAGNTCRLDSISVGDDDDDNPHHFVLTWETGTGTLSLYVDGVLKGSATNAALIGMTFTRAQPFTVAASANTSGTQLFSGEVDEVAIYHYKLSPAQIVNHFNVGKGVTAYETAVLSSWPSRFYMLDETSGDIVNVAERKATPLPPTGTPGYGISGLVENNPAGTAIQFDGASYFRGANFVFQDDVTVAFIMNLAAPPAAYTIIVDQYDGGASTGGIVMGLATDGRLEFDCKTIGSGVWRVNKSAYSVCDGVTHHCVATIENNNLLLYVDGVRQPFNTNSNPTGSCYYNTPLAIGAYFYGTAQFHYAGKLDCVALWDRALTKTEINRLYVAAKVVTEDTYANEILADTPTVFYKFDESSGAVITDYSGNAYSGTYVGSPVLAQQPIVQDDGFSMILNGSSQYARVDTTAIQPGTGDFSVEISFNTGAAGIRQTLLDCRHPSIEAGFLIGIDITNGLFMYMADGTPGVSFVTTRSFNDNHDHILTVVYDRSGYAYAYVDGRLALEGYILSEPGNISTGNSIFIGNVGVTSAWTYFKGKIDNFAYFPSVLTPERVVAHARAAGLYDEGETALSNPLFYTKFDNSDGYSVCTNNDGVIDLQGTYTGGIQAVLGLSSDNGQAMDVDASHYLGLNSPGVKGKRNAFTVQVALKPSQISLAMSICGYGDQGQASYAGWNIRSAATTGQLLLNTYNGSWTTPYFGEALVAGESHLWTFTVDYDRNLIRLHKDGQHVQDTTLGTTTPPTGTWYNQPVYVGISDINFLQYPFYGVIDDFMFYDHALPDDEIQRIAQDRGFYPTVGPVFDYYEVIEALGPNQWFKMQAGELATNSAIGAPDATNTDVTETAGLIDGAGSFNGSTSHLVVPADPTHANLTIPGGHIAAECLIYLNNVTSTLDMIATKGNDTATNLGWNFRIDTNNRAHIILFTAGNWLRYTSTAAIPRQQWIHLAFSAYCGADTSQEKLWVNGAPVAVTHESNWSGTPWSDASYPLIIGKRYVDGTPPGDYPMNAILDNISIYNKPLSDVEVLRLATAAGLA